MLNDEEICQLETSKIFIAPQYVVYEYRSDYAIQFAYLLLIAIPQESQTYIFVDMDYTKNPNHLIWFRKESYHNFL